MYIYNLTMLGLTSFIRKYYLGRLRRGSMIVDSVALDDRDILIHSKDCVRLKFVYFNKYGPYIIV